jgi:hypothetical protein
MRYSMAGHHRRHYPDKEEPEIETKGNPMKEILDKIPKTIQWLVIVIGGVSALSATAYGVYGHFQTDIEANASHTAIKSVVAQNQQKQIDVFKQDRIDRHVREIKRIEYKLISEKLTIRQVDYLNSQKLELRDTIACIRAGTC